MCGRGTQDARYPCFAQIFEMCKKTKKDAHSFRFPKYPICVKTNAGRHISTFCQYIRNIQCVQQGWYFRTSVFLHFALNIQMCKKMRRTSGVHTFPKYAHSISDTPSFTFCQIFVGYQIFDFWMLFELGLPTWEQFFSTPTKKYFESNANYVLKPGTRMWTFSSSLMYSLTIFTTIGNILFFSKSTPTPETFLLPFLLSLFEVFSPGYGNLTTRTALGKVSPLKDFFLKDFSKKRMDILEV